MTVVDGFALGQALRRRGETWRIFSFRLDDFGRYRATLILRRAQKLIRRRVLTSELGKWANS